MSNTTAVLSFDLKILTIGLVMAYMSKTEVRFEKIRSLIRSQKAIKR